MKFLQLLTRTFRAALTRFIYRSIASHRQTLLCLAVKLSTDTSTFEAEVQVTIRLPDITIWIRLSIIFTVCKEKQQFTQQTEWPF